MHIALSIGAEINDLGWPWCFMHCFKTRAMMLLLIYIVSHSICF